MFRHIVLLRFRDDATEEQRRAVLEGLAELPHQIDEVRAFAFGSDAGLAEENADIGVVADFDDAEGYLRYAQHPAHLELIAHRIRPILAQRVAVQHELRP